MDLKAIRADFLSAFEKYSRSNYLGAKFVKIVLIIGGALAVAVALGLDVARATGEISFWTIGLHPVPKTPS
jgi:hypothetical protein